MTRKILAISDDDGKEFISETQPEWNSHGFELVDKDFNHAISENHIKEFSLIVLTMNHEHCDLYNEYAKTISLLSDVPIVCFTYGQDFNPNDKIKLLDGDADEVMSLPIDIKLAVGNCLALIRRNIKTKELDDFPIKVIVYKYIILDSSTFAALVDGKRVTLSKLECEILYFLMIHHNQIMTYNQIYQNVWGVDYIDSPKNILWNQIRNIRRKIQWHPGLPNFICSKRGVGYRFNSE